MERGNIDIDTSTIGSRSEKVLRIFLLFDANQDGYLNRDELAALVVAVNPRVKFSEEQINAITDEIFRCYREFIDDKGLTYLGLLRTYDDGAGDVDRDFDSLGLDLETAVAGGSTSSIADERVTEPKRMAEWAVLLNHTIVFDDTFKLLDDLDILIQNLKSKQTTDGQLKNYNLGPSPSTEISGKRMQWDESGQDYAIFVKELSYLGSRADWQCSRMEAFDRRMAIGRVLYNYHLYNEALTSFKRALELQPTNVIPRFRAGNCLYELGRPEGAKGEYFKALEVAEANRNQWAYVVPQIHVNLGIVLQGEGMVLHACEHYSEAVILCPTHFRALKRLGSGLFAVGEYRAAVKALEEAIFLKRDYVDAHYDLALALLAMGDEEIAMLEFQRVLDLEPGHVDALYNLGELYMDRGRYLRAYEMYKRVLVVWPIHWKAQLSKVVLLFKTGDSEEAKKVLKEALKMTDRIDLHDRIAYLKQLQKKRLLWNGSGSGQENNIIVEPSKFKTADVRTTSRVELANALDIRAFQKITRLNQCDAERIKNQMNKYFLPISYSASNLYEKSILRVSLEGILRELFGFLKAETFVEAVKAINHKVLSVLDELESGRVDLSLFFAVVAPLCRGPPERRKQVAYDALWWRPGNEGGTKIRKTDAQKYFKLLRAIYIPSLEVTEMLEMQEEMDPAMVSLPEFFAMFDDPDSGFGTMSTLLKLETGNRNGSYVCATCFSAIIGSRFKEMKCHFSLCGDCYSEGNVPFTFKQEEYIFKEYPTEAD